MSNSRTPVRLQHHKPRPRRRYWAVLIGFVCLLAVTILPAIYVNYPIAGLNQPSSEGEIQTVNSGEAGTGTVVVQTPKESCTLMKFDNRTGRTIESARHCEKTTVLDAKGVPVPEGTIHRLDSISKSFLGDKH
ncbi:MAG TPA: hypothetical protein VMJ52_09285 [Xanthobacteraceae bacterium]|nr:hypothetical protein [Xanthobacteraceae bacterium]